MGRSPCCDKVGLKKGPWTPEEDQRLLAYIEEHGHGSWRALPTKAGLQRCGKSCRLRWTNYLRPDIKRGKFSLQEEQTIIQLHALLGNRWSAIATHLPKRTDNEIKNYWNTHLKKRLAKMGIDPVTHKPKNDALLSSEGQSKNAANLSHMAQWESARLEAEARLVRESKLRSQFTNTNAPPPPGYIIPGSASTSAQPSRSLDVLKVWNNSSIGWSSKSSAHHRHHHQGNSTNGGGLNIGIGSDIESPTSTLTFSENAPPPPPPQIINSISAGSGGGGEESPITMIEFVGNNSGNSSETGILKDDQGHLNESSMSFTSTLHDHMTISIDGAWTPESLRASSTGHGHIGHVMEEGFTNLLLSDSNERVLSDNAKESSDNDGNGRGGSQDYYEDNKNYWSSILNLVNSSSSDSPMF